MACAYISSFSRNWRFFRGAILRSRVFLNFHPEIILVETAIYICLPPPGTQGFLSNACPRSAVLKAFYCVVGYRTQIVANHEKGYRLSQKATR